MTRTFSSISSDNVLFDFELIIKRTKKEMSIDEISFMTLVREFYKEQYPHTSPEERIFMVGNYLTSQMTYDKFVTTLDILKVNLSLTISK